MTQSLDMLVELVEELFQDVVVGDNYNGYIDVGIEFPKHFNESFESDIQSPYGIADHQIKDVLQVKDIFQDVIDDYDMNYFDPHVPSTAETIGKLYNYNFSFDDKLYFYLDFLSPRKNDKDLSDMILKNANRLKSIGYKIDLATTDESYKPLFSDYCYNSDWRHRDDVYIFTIKVYYLGHL